MSRWFEAAIAAYDGASRRGRLSSYATMLGSANATSLQAGVHLQYLGRDDDGDVSLR